MTKGYESKIETKMQIENPIFKIDYIFDSGI